MQAILKPEAVLDFFTADLHFNIILRMLFTSPVLAIAVLYCFCCCSVSCEMSVLLMLHFKLQVVNFQVQVVLVRMFCFLPLCLSYSLRYCKKSQSKSLKCFVLLYFE